MQRIVLLVLAIGLVLAAGGCGKRQVPVSGRPAPSQGSVSAPVPSQQPGPVPKGTFKPYTIAGRTYYPLSSADGYVEEGVASWYGYGFHGKKTANGETYDMRAMTAAHKILPMNTYIRVTRLDNGRAVTLRVNDRGPFVGSRIVDLSQAGAEQLEMVGPGTARVRLEVVGVAGQATPHMAQALASGRYYVQVGSFRFRDNAERLARQLVAGGYSGSRMQEADIEGVRYWRVQAGAFEGMARAKRAHADLRSKYPGAFLIAD